MAAVFTTATDGLADIRLLRLLQLVSPALPVGAFAYSQGLEWAVAAGWVSHARQAADWIGSLLIHNLANLEVPILSRLYSAWQTDRIQEFEAWNDYLLACRGSAELQQEDLHMGQTLRRLWLQLQPDRLKGLSCSAATFTAMFAVAACNWSIQLPAACSGLLWSWCENQVAAAMKLMPLGQTEGQKILMSLAEAIPGAVQHGLALKDNAIGAAAPGLSMANALHETQYCRIFRS
jgi:urease accessory protein